VVGSAIQRRLAAILVADVVGYARLMGDDEAGTLAILKERRKVFLDPIVKAHGGRVVKFMGDGVLIEFASAVKAVEAALELQTRFAAANENAAESHRITLRIGINLGDVIGEGTDIYGDGVNIAARLEALAPPGGVCVSGKVHAEALGKIDVAFIDLGDQVLKNIATLVRAYHVVASGDAIQPRSRDGAAREALAGWVDPEKQSIAVLPFLNMSGDAEQEYFSDGITEDIITELSRFKNLFVISRNSSFHYKRRAEKAKEIGRELSANYVVEGSVRKAGSRVRVTVQLIESASDRHLWAERYDRDLQDVFQVQDELVRAIASAIPGEVRHHLMERVRRKPPENLTAYECELRGRWAYSRANEGVRMAIEWYERAIEADPNYAVALAGLARAHAYGVFMLGTPATETFAKAGELASRAVGLDDRNPDVFHCAAYVSFLSGDNETARFYVERALALNPNDHLIMQTMGEILSYGGHGEEALRWFAESEKLVPYARDDRRLDILCEAYYMLHQYEKVRQLASVYNDIPNYFPIAAACAQLGDFTGVEREKARFFADNASFTREDASRMIATHLQMCVRLEDREHWIDGYRKAGLPI